MDKQCVLWKAVELLMLLDNQEEERETIGTGNA